MGQKMKSRSKKQNIHGIIIYSKDPDYRFRYTQFIVNERRFGDFHDLFMDADFIFCKKLSQIKKLTAKYEYTVVIIDWMGRKESLSKLRAYVKGFPGYHNTSYKHFTYIRTEKIITI